METILQAITPCKKLAVWPVTGENFGPGQKSVRPDHFWSTKLGPVRPDPFWSIKWNGGPFCPPNMIRMNQYSYRGIAQMRLIGLTINDQRKTRERLKNGVTVEVNPV